jgi:hypothetical protein
VDATGLREQLGGVVFSQEQMVDHRSDLNAEPLSKLAILYAEITDGLLLLNLFEQHGETVALDYVASESGIWSILFDSISVLFYLLLHILIKLSCTLPRNLIKPLLLFDTLLVDHLSPVDIVNVLVSGRDRICAQKLLNSLGIHKLRIVQNRANERPEGDALVFTPENHVLNNH